MVLTLVVLVGLVVVAAAVSYVVSSIILYPHRQPITRSPKEYGMEYEDIAFKSTDGVTISGWYIPGQSKKVIILTHAMPFNRHGFSVKNQGPIKMFKTEVDLLTTAQVLNKEGYSVLMFDFRNHGQSGRGKTAVGLNEYQDVLGALDYLKNRSDPQEVGFCSFCMGANSTIVAMSKDKEKFNHVKCLVAIQPISMYVFVRIFAKKMFSFIGLAFLPLIKAMVKWRGGHALEDMSPKEFAHDISVPTLYIQAESDPWTELSDIKSFYDKTPTQKDFWMIKEKIPRFETYNYIGKHPERVTSFFRKYL